MKNPITTLFAFVFCLLSFDALAQNPPSVRGRVSDKNSLQPLQGVSVAVLKDSKVIGGTASNERGFFMIENLKPDTYALQFTFIGYQTKKQVLILGEEPKMLGTILLEVDNQKLKEVTVQTTQIRVEQKGDTTSINADAYKVNSDATAEDLVKKMPGITVENGQVKAQGEDLKKVLVDGKEFFGDDAQMALRNLPAEVVDKVQIFDRMNDQAQFTGFRDGNTDKTMNILTKNGKNQGAFGKVYAGYGTDERYQAGLTLNYFKNSRRITLLGMSNNINQQNFSMQDLFGSSGGRMGAMIANRNSGGGRMPSMPGSGGMGDFMVGQQPGIAKTHSTGINYTDKWGKNTNVQASYFFNQSNTYTEKVINRNFLVNPEIKQLYSDSTVTDNDNFNHRFNLRLEHAFDTMNALIFTPKFNYQGADLFSNQYAQNSVQDTFLNSTQTNSTIQNRGYNAGGSLLYRHKFNKQGRTISANIGADFNRRNSETNQDSRNTFLDSLGGIVNKGFRQFAENTTNGNSYNGNITYTENISAASQLSLGYNPSIAFNLADRLTRRFDSTSMEYTVVDSILSNTFDNTVTTHKIVLGYNYNKGKYSISAGLTQQFLTLASIQSFPIENSFEKPFSNFLPSANVQYKLSQTKTLRLAYRTNTNTPSVNQLQNVIDNSNPLLLSAGNPTLKQEYSHTLIFRYGSNNWQNAQSLFVFAMVNFIEDYIANANFTSTGTDRVIEGIYVPRGSQLTLPVNQKGYFNSRSFATYGIPLKKLKSNLNLNLGVNYSKVPGLVNAQTNFANTFNINSGFVLGSNISEKVDFTLSHNANISLVQNTLIENTNNNFFINASSLKVNLIPYSGWVLTTDLTYNNYQGLDAGFNQDFLLWNAGVGYKFLKKLAEVRLTVFDLLNQNASINRTVTETYIEDNRSNVLRRYFMLTFTYNIRRFNYDAARENGALPMPGPGGRPQGSEGPK